MIPTETNYAEWFTCSARYYLLKEGYAFFTFSVGQVIEAGFPSTRLLAEGNRLVGLVFCAPVEPVLGQRVSAWKADPTARERMSTVGWALYALPQSADPLDQQLTHQKVLFSDPGDVELAGDGTLRVRMSTSFKQVLDRMRAGSLGFGLPVGWSAEDFAATAAAHPATLYLVTNASARVVFALRAS